MSWDAHLVASIDGHEVELGAWNYTHNCNHMVATVLEEAGIDLGEPHWLIGHMGKSWFDKLEGRPALEGRDLLSEAIRRLEAEPERFRAMNPENGWGDYDGLLRVLQEMREAAAAYPSTTWQVSG